MGKCSSCQCVGSVQFSNVSMPALQFICPFADGYRTMSFTYLFQPLLLSQPPAPIPYAEVPEKEGWCLLYTCCESMTDLPAFFRSECTRSVIILDCLKTLVDPDEPASSIKITPEQTEVLYLRLKNWYNERPQSLLPTTSPSPENLLTA